MLLTLEVHNRLGKIYYYPADEAGKALVTLMDRKALVDRDLPRLKSFILILGHNLEVEFINAPLPANIY